MLTIAGLKRRILEFLQTFFAQGRFFNPVDGAILFKFDPDPTKTDLIIRDKNYFNASELGKMPMIVLDRGLIRPMKTSMAHQLESYDPVTGTKYYLDIMHCPLVIHCLSDNDEEAETLAHTVGMAFWMHKDKVLCEGMHVIEFDAIGSPSIILGEEQREWRAIFDVPVSINAWLHIGFGIRDADAVKFSGIENGVSGSGGPIAQELEVREED